MTDPNHDHETPEGRAVEGLLGLLDPAESERIERRLQSALVTIEDLRLQQRRRMRTWRSLAGALGAAAVIALMAFLFLGDGAPGQNAIADIDRTLERISSLQAPRSYEIEIGRKKGSSTNPLDDFVGHAYAAPDGRFVAFIHRKRDAEKNEFIVGNDGMEDWVIPARGRHMSEPMLRMISDRLRSTVASGSVDPARILRLVRQGWNLDRIKSRRNGKPVTRVEASLPTRKRDRGITDHIVLEIDPDTFSLERLEASRKLNGVEDASAYLLFKRSEPERVVPGFTKRDYLRTDRPRDPDPSS